MTVRYSQAVRYQRAELPLKLDSLAAAWSFFSGCFADEAAGGESLWVAHLNDQAHCLHVSRYGGDRCGVDIPLRAIIVDASIHGSTAILLAHNHPSGDARPSASDLRATRRLATAAEAIHCNVLDHLVFAGAECTSLRSLGYL